jgi:hypothetical protein
MAKLRTLPALLAMCQLALTYQPAWEGGPFAAVRPYLEDDEAWRWASPEMLAMRWLQWATSCFVLANQSRHKLGLVEDTWLIHTSLGPCWLSLPSARRAFEELSRQTPWAGPRPDGLKFYTATADETRQLVDPRFNGKALINLVRFTRDHHLGSDLRRARFVLRRLMVDGNRRPPSARWS